MVYSGPTWKRQLAGVSLLACLALGCFGEVPRPLAHRVIRCDFERTWFQSIAPVELRSEQGFNLAAVVPPFRGEPGGMVAVFSREDGGLVVSRDVWPADVDSLRGQLQSVADVSADGTSDLAVIVRGTEPGVSGLILLADESLDVIGEFFVSGRTVAAACRTGDFDGDGLDDLALALTSPGSLEVRSSSTLELLREISVPWIAEDIVSRMTLQSRTHTGGTQLLLGNPILGGASPHSGGVLAYSIPTSPAEIQSVEVRQARVVSTVKGRRTRYGILCAPAESGGLADVYVADDHSFAKVVAFAKPGWVSKRALTRPDPNDHGWPFGEGLSFCDDISGDGIPDVVVGFPEYNGPSMDTGALYFYSGADHEPLGIVVGETDLWRLGQEICDLGSDSGAAVIGVLCGFDLLIVEVQKTLARD